MKTIIKIITIISFFGLWIVMMCVPELQHKYLGIVDSKISKEEISEGNDEWAVIYTFTYKNKNGRKCSSKNIQSEYPVSIDSFKTFEGSWVEKQLLEKGKVYVPGWQIWYSLVFTLYTTIIIWMFIIHIIEIKCILEDNPSYYECERCSAPPTCPFSKYTLEQDSQQFQKYIPKLKQFFGYI